MRFSSFFEILEHYSKISPDAAALKYKERSWTFSALEKEAAARAEQLRQSGKTCLAVLSDGSAECVINIFAANHAGLQVVMLDETLPEDLLAQLLAYSDADMLWTADEELAEILKPALIRTSDEGRAAEPASASASKPDEGSAADRILFFTSGTASRSKAVALTGKSLCSSAWNGSQMLPLSPDDTLLCCLPLAHVFGFVCGLLWGLSCGACVAISTENSGHDPYAMDICPDDTITIAEDGEVLIHAPTCMMQGYYKDPEATKKVLLSNGYFATGDIGWLTDDGSLILTGRMKDTIVLSNGENIEPESIEQSCMTSPFVKQVVLTGQDKEFLSALIVPDMNAISEYAKKKNISNPLTDTAFKNEVLKDIREKVQKRTCYRAFERIADIAFVDEEFTPENGMMTQTAKIKKNVVLQKYADKIESMYR